MDTIYIALIALSASALSAVIGWHMGRTSFNEEGADIEREACASVADEATEWAETLLSTHTFPDAHARGFQSGCEYTSKTIARAIRGRKPAL